MLMLVMWVGSRLPLSVVWDNKTFNIHNLQLTTSMLSVYIMMENKTHTSYGPRAFHLCVFQLRANLGSWEIKNKQWIDWRSSPSSQQTGSSGTSMGMQICQWFESSHLLLQKALVSSSSACQRAEFRGLQCHRPGLCMKLAFLLVHKGRGQ